MWAIVEIKGKQYKIEPGQKVVVDYIAATEQTNDLSNIKVLYGKTTEGKTLIGKPYLDSAKVKAAVESEVRGPKLRVVRYRPKSGINKIRGHKQKYTRLKIEEINF